MKTSIIALAISLISVFSVKAQHSLRVTITDLENDNGQVMVELVDENNQAVQQVAENISNGESTFTFNDVKSGTYAIRYYHDENGNGKMDTGTFGIPKEGYGFSNNARGFMGPPDFEDMLFKVNEHVKLTLKTVN